MTPEQLDRAYFALCAAMRSLDSTATTKFLARLTLLLLSEHPSADVVMQTIEDAKNAE